MLLQKIHGAGSISHALMLLKCALPLVRYFTAASLAAADEINAASSCRTCATTTIAVSACFHCFDSIASRTAGIVFTAYPV